MDQSEGKALLIESGKLRQLLSATRLGIIISSVMAMALVYVQRGLVADNVLIIWLLAVLTVAIWRSIWVTSIQTNFPENDSQAIHIRLVQFRALAFLAGLVWGLAGYFLLPASDPQHTMFLLFLLGGLSAGGIVSYSVDFISASLYTTFILIPVMFSLLLVESQFSTMMSFSVVVYLLFLMSSLRNINNKSIDNILLRIDSNQKDSSIKEGEDRYHLLLQHLPIGVFHFDKNKIVTFCNQRLNEVLNNSPYFKEGSNLNYLSNKDIKANLKATLNESRISRYEGLYDCDLDDSEQWISMLIAPSENNPGEVSGGIGIVQDITERKQAGQLIERFALQDYLTELPNRRMLIDRMHQALDDNANTHKDVALLYIDLDDFKDLNDALGHAVGDLLLQQVAKRLSKCLRQKDMVARAARIGGDEFVILLENLSEKHDKAINQVEIVSNKIFSKLSQSFKLDKHKYQCSVSIGAALYNAHGGTVDDFLRHADIAMYEAKEVGNVMRFYSAEMLEVINKREDIKSALQGAIQHNELILYYQIQVDALQNPIGAEALIRWNRPGYGLVPPFEFIPLAEETGLILPIGIWALHTACNQLSQWAKNPVMQGLTVAINVSVKQLMESSFADEVSKSIKKYKINPALLKIELTESMFLENAPKVIKNMSALQELGVAFELDDFGTGYSCLQYLKQLPLKQLKIDQTFVRDINKDKSDQSIVKTIIAMADGFNIDVIAEGVETEAQFSLLGSYGCHHFQGYYFGKPLPVDAFEAALSQKEVIEVVLTSEE